MLKFILKLLLFATPLIPLYGFPLYVYWQARELMPLDQVIYAQAGAQESLYGLAYVNIERTYKIRLAQDRDPDVLVIGNSHVLQFRGAFFANPHDFLNGGGAVHNMRQAILFVEALPHDDTRRVILFGLDDSFFGSQDVGSEDLVLLEQIRALFSAGRRQVYIDYFSGKFSLADLSRNAASSRSIGLNALINQNGYLNDGSYYYGQKSHDPARISELRAQNSAMLLASMEQQVDPAQIPELWQEGFQELETFLKLCKERNIYVIGFMPPIGYTAVRSAESPPDWSAQSAEVVMRHAKSYFEQNGFPLFDYFDAHSSGIKESEFVDWDHPTDKADLRILIDMAEHDTVLNRYIDLNSLRSLLKSTKGDFVIDDLSF